jgi:hypothetical protein
MPVPPSGFRACWRIAAPGGRTKSLDDWPAEQPYRPTEAAVKRRHDVISVQKARVTPVERAGIGRREQIRFTAPSLDGKQCRVC